MAKTKPYRWLAEYYDDIFGPMRSPLSAAREKLLQRILPDVKIACDLACGTGESALDLAQRGIRVYATDLSPTMCALTREKARRAGANIRVIRADMRNFRMPERVDLVTCEFDALNHIPEKKDLAKVAKSVARALKPGGHFFFDVNNAPGFAQYWTGAFPVERPGLLMLMRNGHSIDLQRAWCEVDWFVQEGRSWRRHRERVEEVCWSADEIDSAFRVAGFVDIRHWDAARFFSGPIPSKKGCRSLYLLQRR